ncbi:hypothetical protein Tco_0488189 [Tanacetum coccineum]
MVEDNVGNQFRPNKVQNVRNHVVLNAVQNPGVQNVGNQNGLSVVQGITNQHGNGNVIAARAEGNSNGNNGNHIRNNYDCSNKVNLLHASTSGISLTKLSSMIHMDQLSVEQSGGTVEQHPVNVEETRVLYDSLYNNLAIEVERVNLVNRKLRETNTDLTTELARYKNQEKCFEINQEKYEKLERMLLEKHDPPAVYDSEETLQLAQENTVDPLSQKLENENMELEFQALNYAKENAHLKTTYKNLFDSITMTRTQTETIIDSLQNKLHDTIYENAKLRAQLFDKVSEQKDITKGTSVNTKLLNQSTERKPSLQPLRKNLL